MQIPYKTVMAWTIYVVIGSSCRAVMTLLTPGLAQSSSFRPRTRRSNQTGKELILLYISQVVFPVVRPYFNNCVIELKRKSKTRQLSLTKIAPGS